MKLGILTRSDKKINEMTKLTHPMIKDYAEKCGAEFEIIEGDPPAITHDNHPHWRIAHLYTYYNKYDRILCLDSDIVITNNCPDIFKEVPEDCIGTIFEDKGTRQTPRRESIRDIQNMYGDIGWKSGYINTGVFLTSKMHRDIFKAINGNWYTNWGSDDVHIGYQIRKLGFKIHELSFKWNHMTMFSEPWNHNANRFNSYIIHYAGRGQFDLKKSRLNNIRSDIKEVKNDSSDG